MARPVAKAKKKWREQAEAEAMADEQLRQAAKPIPSKDARSNTNVSVKEIRNVMADSFERLWEELSATRGMENVRLQAEESAHYITGSLTHGLHGFGGPVKIREEPVTPHYCQKHKEEK